MGDSIKESPGLGLWEESLYKGDWIILVTQRDPPNARRLPPVALNGQLFHPSPKLRWLGYWFVPNLASSAYFSRPLAVSQVAFAAIRPLSSYRSGVPPYLCHRLAFSLLFPILSYDADHFIPSKDLLSKMDVHRRQDQRWVSNCFLITPLTILAAEACVPPLSVLLPYKRRMVALWLVCSPPQIYPATARLSRSFPSLLKFRIPDSHHPLCTWLDPNVMPLHWKTPRPSTPVRSHLPVDALAHLTHLLLKGLSFAPLINLSLLQDLPPLLPDGVMRATYSSLKTKAHLLMFDSWHMVRPPSPYYTFPLSLTPYPFMGLGKCMAGRIHQMRAQKSYLPAYPSWSSPDVPRLCSHYGEEHEIFSHAGLCSPAKAAHRSRDLQGLTSVGPDASLWSSVSLLTSLATYIQATTTNYLPDMFPSLPPLPTSMVFLSPPASPLPGGLLSSPPARPI